MKPEELLSMCEKAVEEALKLGAGEAEAIATWSRAVGVEVEKLQLKSARAHVEAGLGVRVALGRKVGFSFTSHLTPDSIRKAAERAVEVAKAKPEDPLWPGLPGPAEPASVQGLYDPKAAEATLEDAAELARQMIEAMKVDARVKAGSGGVGFAAHASAIANSRGLALSAQGTSAHASAYAVAEEAGDSSAGFEYEASRQASDISPLRVGEAAGRMAVENLGKKSIETATMDVVLHPLALASLLSIVTEELSGENLYKKRTPLAGKLGEQVASEELTLVDDGVLEKATRTWPFDAEGVPSRRTVLVERGVLKSFIFDRYWGKACGAESTGNASRGYSSEPRIAPRNLVVEAGSKPLSELISEVDEGMLVVDFMGTHTANIPSGDFSVVAYLPSYIKGGELKHPVKQAMISGNILDFIAKVDAVSREVKNLGRALLPYVRVRGVRVSA
ncbi:MAG: TldD/PmbA family protein [Thermoproteota archaeon]|nr:MAG: TldD/PmbA family protein [Candidatus Korarchaeota archaeon]